MKIGKNFRKAVFLPVCLLLVGSSTAMVVWWIYTNFGAAISVAAGSATNMIRTTLGVGDYARKLALPRPSTLGDAGDAKVEFRKALESRELSTLFPHAGTEVDSTSTRKIGKLDWLRDEGRIASIDPSARSESRPTPSPRSGASPKTAAKSDPDADCRSRLLTRGVVHLNNVPCVDVEAVVANLRTAVYRFNKPDHAYVGEAFRVVLVLPTASGQDVKSPFLSVPGEIERRTAPYAQNMEASLRGDPDLKITPAGPQERVTTSLAPTTWEWTIVAGSAGSKTLVIEVTVQLVIGPDRTRVPLPAIYEPVHVRVRPEHWVAALGTFAGSALGLAVNLATLAIGVLGVLHYVRYRRTEDVPGADLLGHHGHQDGGSHDGGSHPA